MKIAFTNKDRRNFLRRSGALALGATCLPRFLAGHQAATTEAKVEQLARPKVASGNRGVVATVHPLASQAAIAAFERGGNAIDAAVAASLMLSVVDGFNSGIGGGCLAMIRTASGKVHAIDGREQAPKLAQPEMFFRGGKPDPSLSQEGPLAAGVPGLLAALERLATNHGQIDWRDAARGAGEVAEDGFDLDANYVGRLRSAADRLKKYSAAAEVLLDDFGRPWPVGHRLRQPDLAHTLNQIANHGVEWFYEGEFAERVEQFMASQGGLLKVDDFSEYKMVARTPIRCSYRDHSVFGFPPPSSGGIHNCQMLTMLSGFEVREVFETSPAEGYHLLLEVMKRAMADRAHWLGDSDFAKVPRGLLDVDYLKQRASSIRLDRASSVESHGIPPGVDVDLFGRGGHTTHLTTADADGNVVAITQTINTTFGCKMIVPGTGVVLNNELDDFSIAPGVRNAFGLLGSEANLIAPGKRPLSSMSPTIVLDAAGVPALSCGAAGGPRIITAVLQILVGVLDLGRSIDEAVAAARVHHQWSPDQAICEQAIDASIIEKLRGLGHDVRTIPASATAQGLGLAALGLEHALVAASDPRVPSCAMSL